MAGGKSMNTSMENKLKTVYDILLMAKTETDLKDAYINIMNVTSQIYNERLEALNTSNDIDDDSNKETDDDADKTPEMALESVTEDSKKDEIVITEGYNAQKQAVNEEIVNEEAVNEKVVEEPPEAEEPPAYAVFYSINNAAYVAVNDAMHACVPVRNIAKAYCVEADMAAIAVAQNELSKFNLAKLKPIRIEFITQRQYDETIGKAKAMQAIMEAAPITTSKSIDTGHKVANFASNTKNASNTHIGNKSYEKYNKGYDFYHSNVDYGNNKMHNYDHTNCNLESANEDDASVKLYPFRDQMENPKWLYKSNHVNLDNDVIPKVRSYGNDIPSFTVKDIENFKQNCDYAIVNAINETLMRIKDTKASWMTDKLDLIHNADLYHGNFMVDTDYILDIDYSLLDDAISEFNLQNETHIMYVEDFDPTMNNFLRNIYKINGVSYNSVREDDIQDVIPLVEMAIFNYTVCLIAYELYKSYCLNEKG